MSQDTEGVARQPERRCCWWVWFYGKDELGTVPRQTVSSFVPAAVELAVPVSRPAIWRGTAGKEICDLLVVFDRHLFVFSDKYCAFPDTGDIALDWCRWYKRAIKKSADQVWGASAGFAIFLIVCS